MKRILLAVVALVTLITPQISQAYTWPGNKWPQGNPTVVNVTIGSSLPSAWAYYMGRAMGTWNNAGAKFQFQASLDNKHKINLRSMPWMPGALAVTYIYEGWGSRTTSDRDIDINSIFSWDINGATNKYDAWGIVTHELGHWLTLDDLYSSGNSDATMYWTAGPGETKKRDLTADDIGGIRRIYGSR